MQLVLCNPSVSLQSQHDIQAWLCQILLFSSSCGSRLVLSVCQSVCLFVYCFASAEILDFMSQVVCAYVQVGMSISGLPEGFNPHKGIKRVFEGRRKMVESGEGVDWGFAEALAFGTLVSEGERANPKACSAARTHCSSAFGDDSSAE